MLEDDKITKDLAIVSETDEIHLLALQFEAQS